MADEELLQAAQQDTVQFYGKSIVAVRLPDGRIGAVFTDLCNALGLVRSSQMRRVREDDTTFDQLLDVEMDPDGTGKRPTAVLTAWAIPLWLTGLNASRVSPEKRDAIRAFKREAADALYKHFSQPQLTLSAPTSLVPEEPITQPDYPPSGASPSAWLRYHQQMVAFLEWQQDIEEWRGGVEDRLETMEELTRLVPEILERLGPVTLSAEHQQTVQASVKRLHDVSGIAFPTIYSDLTASFHVPRYGDIPESSWLEVAEWFRVRIAAAEKRKKHST